MIKTSETLTQKSKNKEKPRNAEMQKSDEQKTDNREGRIAVKQMSRMAEMQKLK